ncbi:MAG: amidohydrolase family protein [Burkholderiaceae bacterium]|nr:amidohydrolase family protein [Burkholderiaceae bacterium]
MTADAADVSAHGWDCHAHLFGPYDRFPLAAQRSYTPPEAADHQYLALLARLGLAHGVLVHPSAYGDDFSLLFDALERHARLRGVIVLRPDMALASAAGLAGLRARGVRAARFSHRSGAGGNFAGSASLDDLLVLAPRLADAGLHAELWTDTQALPDIAERLRGLPVPVVIDHMGGFDAAAGVQAPGFQQLCALLAEGRVWVKLCAYRNLLGGADAQAGRPFHQALLGANPEALVWGSDWPHLRVAPAPDAVALLDLCRRWTADERLFAQLMQTNPARLYG